MCRQFRFDNKSQFRVFLAKPQKAADLKLCCSGYVIKSALIAINLSLSGGGRSIAVLLIAK